MPGKVDLSGREILFLLVDGFESFNIRKMMNCFSSMSARVGFASPNEGDMMTSANGDMSLRSNYSFDDAAQGDFDAVIVADDVTAKTVRHNPTVEGIIKCARDAAWVVATVDEGALLLLDTHLADDAVISAPDSVKEDPAAVGVEVTSLPVSYSDNVMTAGPGANLEVFCRDIANFIVSGKAMAA